MTRRGDSPPAEEDGPARAAPYVLQVKLQPEERSVVARAARASDLPTSTWARRELLRQAEEAVRPRSEVRQEVSLASGGCLRLAASGMDRASSADRDFVLQLVRTMLAYGHAPEGDERASGPVAVTRDEEAPPGDPQPG